MCLDIRKKWDLKFECTPTVRANEKGVCANGFTALTCTYTALRCSLCVCKCAGAGEGDQDGGFVIVIWMQCFFGRKVTSLSILPFSLSMLYWEVPLLICVSVLETWWEMGDIKASISLWWQRCTAILKGLNSWICSHVRQSVSSPTMEVQLQFLCNRE